MRARCGVKGGIFSKAVCKLEWYGSHSFIENSCCCTHRLVQDVQVRDSWAWWNQGWLSLPFFWWLLKLCRTIWWPWKTRQSSATLEMSNPSILRPMVHPKPAVLWCGVRGREGKRAGISVASLSWQCDNSSAIQIILIAPHTFKVLLFLVLVLFW